MLIRRVKAFRQELSALLRRVQAGEEILVTEHDRPIARVIAVRQGQGAALGSRRKLRESIPRRGKDLSAILVEEREKAP